MYFLIIKGPSDKAVLEAKSRGVDIMLTQSRSDAETWAYSSSEAHMPYTLMNWFISDVHEHAPFRNGSLLWYKDLER